jgi:hypothetical protein
VTEVHLVIGIGLLATNLVAGVWGAVAWLNNRPSVGFWYALRTAQAFVVLQVMLGLVLVFSGREALDLHYLYGGLPLVISLLAETIRAGAAEQELGHLDVRTMPEEQQREIALAIVRREMGIMAVGSLVIFGLALRAAGTTPVF